MRESDEGRASDEVINRLVEALDERNNHLDGLITVAASVQAEVRGLRKDVFARPTRAEVSHKRRVTAVLIIFFAYFLLLVSDTNTNECSPGHKAGVVVDQIAKGVQLTPAQFLKLTQKRVSPWCDIAFPLHRHDGRDDWPTDANLLGFMLIVVALGGSALYAHGPRHWTDDSGTQEPVRDAESSPAS